MNTQAQTIMLNPLDGALFVSGTALSSVLVLAAGTSPNWLTTIAGAIVAGMFMLLGKVLELWWRGRRDKHIRKLEQQLRDARGAAAQKPAVQVCTRYAGHIGPCNGLQRPDCLG